MSEDAELRLWLIGGSDPLVFRVSDEYARSVYEVLSGAWQDPAPGGAVGFRDGTMIRTAAIAAVRMTLSDRPPHPAGGWVANPPAGPGAGPDPD